MFAGPQVIRGPQQQAAQQSQLPMPHSAAAATVSQPHGFGPDLLSALLPQGQQSMSSHASQRELPTPSVATPPGIVKHDDVIHQHSCFSVCLLAGEFAS